MTVRILGEMPDISSAEEQTTGITAHEVLTWDVANNVFKKVQIGNWPTGSGGIPSDPPSGKCKIVNIYVNPQTNKAVIEYEDIPV